MGMHHIAEIEDREPLRWGYRDSIYTCPFPFNSTDAYMQTKRVVNLASAQLVVRHKGMTCYRFQYKGSGSHAVVDGGGTVIVSSDPRD
jgi:hypothetical protein